MLFWKNAKNCVDIEVHYDDLKKLDRVCAILDYDYDGCNLGDIKLFPDMWNRKRVNIVSKRRKVDARKLDDACKLANFKYGYSVIY